MSSSGPWSQQSTRRPSPRACSTGSRLAHTSIALGQRGWNRQPFGGSIRFGGAPGIEWSSTVSSEIVERSSAKDKAEEGCLSIPDIYADVERPKEVVVRAMTDARGVSNEKARWVLDWRPRFPGWREGFPHALGATPTVMAPRRNGAAA